jgi:hypothetical protein
MRTHEEYRRILQLWHDGINMSQIERMTGIPRPTVRDCIKRYGSLEEFELLAQENLRFTLPERLRAVSKTECDPLQASYAYLLGLYLGDGHIMKMRRVYRLRIFCDARYPHLIDLCREAMERLFPDNCVGTQVADYQGHPSCVTVGLYHKHLPLCFPQHGEGKKHNRAIRLTDWQERIVTTYPLEFFRGLYHSDGSRASNIVYNRDYPRYQFTNSSPDIIQMFTDTCERLGIHWTRKVRHVKGYAPATDIFIARRKDVAFLDQYVGAKS